MSAQPPPSGRPTGPPSGPLSGPSRPGQPPPPPGTPSGPPSGPPGDGGTGGPGGGAGGPEGPGRPWWQSAPRVAIIATALVAAVVVTVVLTRSDGGSVAGGEVFLETAGSSGPDPYTESSARKTDASATASPTEPPSAQPGVSPTQTNVTRAVEGSAPGLYGGTRKVGSCNVEKQITTLTAQQDKNKAFASVLDIEPTGVPAYLRSLTPVQLRMDTRVTNHGYRNGAPTRYQAVLQTGTAVLVDDRGVPRVRCACGNPLLPPVRIEGPARRVGNPWPGFRQTEVVTVDSASRPVKEFVMYDPRSDGWFTRDAGDTGSGDERTEPPAGDTTSPSPDDSPHSPSSESPQTESPAPEEPRSPDAPPSEPAPESPAPESPAPDSPDSPAPLSPGLVSPGGPTG